MRRLSLKSTDFGVDPDFTEGDVKHAATKAIKKTCNRVIFAYGRHATSYPKNFSTISMLILFCKISCLVFINCSKFPFWYSS